MAGDMFLKLEGLDGESVDEASPSHNKEIDIIGWSFGGTNPASFAMGQGGQQSKPVYTDFHITKVCDSASVKLLRAMTGGQHIDKGKITCRKATGPEKTDGSAFELFPKPARGFRLKTLDNYFIDIRTEVRGRQIRGGRRSECSSP